MSIIDFTYKEQKSETIKQLKSLFEKVSADNPDLANELRVLGQATREGNFDYLVMQGVLLGKVLSQPSVTIEDIGAVKSLYEYSTNGNMYLMTFEQYNFEQMPAEIKPDIFKDTMRRLQEEMGTIHGNSVFCEYLCAELTQQLQDEDIKKIVSEKDSPEAEQLYEIVEELTKDSPYETREDFEADFSVAEDALEDFEYYDTIDEFLYTVAKVRSNGDKDIPSQDSQTFDKDDFEEEVLWK